jgi:hypothetical protein
LTIHRILRLSGKRGRRAVGSAFPAVLFLCAPLLQPGLPAPGIAQEHPFPTPVLERLMSGAQEGRAGPGGTHADSLHLSLEVPDRIRSSEEARLTFRVVNVSGGPLDLYLRGRTIAFDLVITGESGEPVWSRLHDEIIPAILRVEHLAAGDTLVLRDSWDGRTNTGDPVPPGTYGVQGVLLTEGDPLRTPVRCLEVEGDGRRAR